MDKKPQPILEARELECRQGDAIVLRGITFSVYPGEMFFVAGGRGSGKSTLLKCLIGLHRPTAGSIRLFGKDFLSGSRTEQRELLRRFGVLFQNDALWNSMTVGENIAFPLEEQMRLARKECHEVVALKLAQVGLAGFQDYSPAELTSEMRKRAALARALALDPTLLFCDEPDFGLDPIMAEQMNALLREIHDSMGIAMVVASHNLPSIMTLADRLIFLGSDEKGIIAEGDPEELARTDINPHVRDFFHAQAPKVKTRRQST